MFKINIYENNINMIIKKIIFKIKEDNINENAASAAFFTIISIIPFFVLLITLIKIINIDKDMIYIILKEFIPSEIKNLLFGVIEEIYSKSAYEISFSLLVTIWSAGKGFFSFSKGIRKIYNIDTNSNFVFRIVGSIYTLLLIVIIIIFLLLIILGKKIYIFMMREFIIISNIVFILYKFRVILIIVFMTIVFFVLYKILGNKKGVFDIFGSIFCAVFWQVISYGISVYIDYTEAYGLTSLIVFMIWVYLCIYMIFIGAEINSQINEKNVKYF